MNDELVQHQDGAVLVLRLNRPGSRNALSRSLVRDLGEAFERAEADPGVRAVVITGTGDRAFSSGMDLKEFDGRSRAGDDSGPAGMDTFLRILDGQVSVPVVGAANGSALAGGLEILMACDVVVASSEARFGLPEVQRGLLAGRGATQIGARLPLALALEMALTGESVEATRAREMGLVNAVVPPDQVLDTALGLARRIAANGPLAVAATRELVRLAAVDHPRAVVRQTELASTVFQSEDAREGTRAFVEKREPVWKGR